MNRSSSQGRDRGPQQSRGLSADEQAQLDRIVKEGDALTTITWADTIGQSLVQNNLTTSQIRNFFGEVRQIQLAWEQDDNAAFAAFRRAVLLIPKIGYHARRARGSAQRGMAELERVLVPGLETVATAKPDQRKTYYTNFVDVFEAILAYHKKHGGRD